MASEPHKIRLHQERTRVLEIGRLYPARESQHSYGVGVSGVGGVGGAGVGGVCVTGVGCVSGVRGAGVGGFGVAGVGGVGGTGTSEASEVTPRMSVEQAQRELLAFTRSEFADVRRLAASALGKLSAYHPGAIEIASVLIRMAIEDAHPQVRQYAAKALAKYPDEACVGLIDLKDAARDESAPGYVRTALADAIAAAQQSHRRRHAALHHWCTRCRRIISDDEYQRSLEQWGKPYCHHCLDERQMDERNFEQSVEDAKRKRSLGGTAVQSRGEKLIADFLERENIAYIYDERYRIAGDVSIRPDFYLPEFDIYIEYFGMNTPEYRDNMLKKRMLYQRSAKKLVSVSYADDANLIDILRNKLARYIRF